MQPYPTRPTRFSSTLLLILMLLASPVLAVETSLLPPAADLKQLGISAQERGVPILLMVSRSHCGFCRQMKQEVLIPMQRDDDYADRVLIRELLIDGDETVTNFEGRQETASGFSSRYRIRVTPTLLFLDSKGNEVATRILGINTPEYMLFYVEDAIASASRSLAHRP